MANFTKLDNQNVVVDVIFLNNDVIGNTPFPESEAKGLEFLVPWSNGYTNWKQTSYNASFRKHYAGVGYVYDGSLDAFIPPKPYPSWLLNTNTCLWEPPVPYPTDGKKYVWDEATLSWVEVS